MVFTLNKFERHAKERFIFSLDTSSNHLKPFHKNFRLFPFVDNDTCTQFVEVESLSQTKRTFNSLNDARISFLETRYKKLKVNR